MTVFTLNAFDNGYFKDGKPTNPFDKFCFNSWLNNGIDVKVFDYTSPEVIEAKNKYDKILRIQRDLRIVCDVIRLYILSLYPNMLYIDTDVCLIDKSILDEVSKIDDLAFSRGYYYFIWNGSRTDKVKTLLEWYEKQEELKADKNTFISPTELKCGISCSKIDSGKIIHIAKFTKNNKIYLADSEKDVIKNVNKYNHFVKIGGRRILNVDGKEVVVNGIPQNLPEPLQTMIINSLVNPERYYELISK